jgi:hypothetical protein
MSFDEYMAWEAEQEEKWELVDGRPVLRSDRWWRDPVTGMAGARADTIASCAIYSSVCRRGLGRGRARRSLPI